MLKVVTSSPWYAQSSYLVVHGNAQSSYLVVMLKVVVVHGNAQSSYLVVL